MARITTAPALADQLSCLDCKRNHVWMDEELGLVVGDYPTPAFIFDFGSETFVQIRQEHPKSPEKETISLIHEAGRKRAEIEIETSEKILKLGSYKQLMVEGLNLIEEMRPGTHQMLSNEPRFKGRTKRPVAASHDDLYDADHPLTHSAKLRSGFFAATNNKSEEAFGYVKSAAISAGLAWGKEFIVRIK